MSEENRARWALIVAVILWGSSYVSIRFAVESYSPGVLALLRYLGASIVMIPLYLIYKQPISHSFFRIFLAGLLGVFGFAIYTVFLNYGELTITAGVTSFVIGFAPLLSIILACIVYRERLKWGAWGGWAISILGLFLLVLSEEHYSAGIGFLYLMVACLAMALYVFLQKKFLQYMNAVEFTSYAIWGGTLALLIYAPTVLPEIQRTPLMANMVVIYMGIFPSALAYICWSQGFKVLSVTEASSYAYLVPFFCLVLAFVFLGEVPSLMSLLGGLISLYGVVLVRKYVV